MTEKRTLYSVQWRPAFALDGFGIETQDEIYDDLVATLRGDAPLDPILRTALADALERGQDAKNGARSFGARLLIQANRGHFERRKLFQATLLRLQRGREIHACYDGNWSKAYRAVLGDASDVLDIKDYGGRAREAYANYLAYLDEHSDEARTFRENVEEMGSEYGLFSYARALAGIPDEYVSEK